jgi:hypothetical protein
MVRAGKSFNEASRITLALSNKSSAVTLMSHLRVVHCTRHPPLGGACCQIKSQKNVMR